MMSGFDPRLGEALALLPSYLSAHIVLSFSALGLGIMLSLPLALLGARSARWRWLMLTTASVIQTIPSLALLALFYPLLLALSLLFRNLTGEQFSALGFLPSLLALTLYSMLPVLRNGVAGLLGVDPAVKEAALGAGMTARQMLLQVELPLALPVIMAGIRTASAWVIGTATLSTAIGQTSLGNYIFTGLQTQNWVYVLVGCVAAAVLALAADLMLALAEAIFTRRKTARLGFAGLALAGTIVAAAPFFFGDGDKHYTIGAKGFGEQYVLAALIEQRLDAAGLTSQTRSNLGSAIAFSALAAGDVDLYVDYSGTIWTNQMNRTDTPSRDVLLREMSGWLLRTHGIRMLGTLGFENAYVLAMRRGHAEALRLRSIAELSAVSRTMTIGGDVEIFGRPEWKALQDRYGMAFGQQREMQPLFLYKAVADGEVDVITAFSSDGRIAQYDLVPLEDTLHAIPPYDAVLLLAPGRSDDADLVTALTPLLNKVSIDIMRQANLAVSREDAQLSPAEAARQLWAAIAGSQ